MDTAEEKTTNTTKSTLSIIVSNDNMNVYLSCTADFVKGENVMEEIRAKYKATGIKAQFDEESFGEILNNASSESKGLEKVLIAEGKEPVNGENGKIEWTGDYFSKDYMIDPVTKRIDFREKKGSPAVTEGQVLAIFIPPTEGEEGINVYGKVLKQVKGKVIRLRINKNIIWDEEKQEYRSKCAGRVKLTANGINVDEVYEIKGNVGKYTGNIKHNGQLVIKGDVESNCRIEVEKDIEVNGLIYASDIICKGILVAREGINGDTKKRIEVNNDLVTKYINNAAIFCNANIIVKKEIFQSHIKTRGEVNCSEGRIVGGEIMTANGITVGEAGCKNNVPTTLIAGVDYILVQNLKHNRERIPEIKNSMTKMNISKNQLEQNRVNLVPQQQELLTELTFNLIEAEEEIEKLENEIKEISVGLRKCRKAEIQIIDMLFPGVILRICDALYRATQTIKGPMIASLDSSSGKIILTSE
ncbi:MAG: DUF342 domain-containing protein [candidate division Zixibacteria bacterium]|nr:DUF342 domain-containing protein [candidate division Zixibacteria bacterium]